MRLGKKLLGLNVFALATGEYIATVKDMLFDLQAGKVYGLIVEEAEKPRAREQGEVFIPLEQVHKIGEDAVTVVDSGSIMKLYEVPEALRLAEADPPLIGTSVMTTAGKLLGSIDDILVDTGDGTILGYQLSDGLIKDMMSGRVAIPASKGYYLGQEAMIVPEDTTSRVRRVEPAFDGKDLRPFSPQWREQVWEQLRQSWYRTGPDSDAVAVHQVEAEAAGGAGDGQGKEMGEAESEKDGHEYI